MIGPEEQKLVHSIKEKDPHNDVAVAVYKLLEKYEKVMLQYDENFTIIDDHLNVKFDEILEAIHALKLMTQNDDEVLQGKLERVTEALNKKLNGLREEIKVINEAFPDDDPRGHRDAHLKYMETAKRRAAHWQKIREHVTTSLSWMLVASIVLAAANSIKEHFL